MQIRLIYNIPNIGDGDYGCAYIDGKIEADGSVYVQGTRGAYHTDITAGDDIECSSEYSCYYSVLESADDMFIEANYAAMYATIDSGDTLSCDGTHACSRATISAEGNIDSSGEYSTYYSTIESGGYVYIRGFNGLSNIYLVATYYLYMFNIYKQCIRC